MAGIQLSIPRRMILVRSITIVSLMIGVLLSLPLWAGQRYFPAAPLLSLPPLLAPWDYIFPMVLLVLLFLALLGAHPRIFLFAALIVLTWLVLNDLNRLQMWTFVYAGMLLVFVFYDGRVDDSSKFTSYFIVLQLIIPSAYFFTGFYQLNPRFCEEVLPDLLQPLHAILSERQFLLVLKLGKTIPYFMMFIGLGLIISPVRYLAITLSVILHLSLLFFIFPSVHNLNYALWFSNISFLIVVLFLFSGKAKQRYYSPTFLLQVPVFYVIFPFYIILPFLNLNNRWPDTLSFNVGTGGEKKVDIRINSETCKNLSLYEAHFFKAEKGAFHLDYQQWCREELHGEPFPDEQVFNSIYRYLLHKESGVVKETEMQSRPRERFLGKP